MSDSTTLPAKLAFTGPTLTTTVAVISLGAVDSSFWQPGMHLASTAGSLSPAQTLSWDAGTIWLSFICMDVLPQTRVIFAGVREGLARRRDARQWRLWAPTKAQIRRRRDESVRL